MRAGWLWCLRAVLGLLAGAVAITYCTVPAESLPPILGRVPGDTTHRLQSGEVAAVVAIGLLLIASGFLIGTHLRQQAVAVWRRLLGR